MSKKTRKNKRKIIKSFLKYKIPDRVKFDNSIKYDLMEFYEISTDYDKALLDFLKNKPKYNFPIEPILYEIEYRKIISKIIEEKVENNEFYILWEKYLKIMDEYLMSKQIKEGTVK